MKKITLLLMLLMSGVYAHAQSTCRQTFSASGTDDGPTVLTINAADVNCNGAGPVTSMKLTGADGSLDSFFCGDWYSFDLSIDGGTPITGCAAELNDVDITGFTTLTITSSDLDAYSDDVDIIIDVEVTFTATAAPACVALSAPTNGEINVLGSTITWPVASGGATGYKLKVGTTSGGTNVLNMFDVGNVTSYDLGTLLPGTTYYVTVVPYNVIGDATACTESSFTTCGAVTVPALEDFTTYLPGCWQEADNGDLTAGPSTFGTSGWLADGFGNNGTTGAIRYNVYTSGANDWIVSPLYTIPATGYELKFEAAATQYATTNPPTTPWEADDSVEVLVSTGTTNWTVLYTYNDTNVPSNTGSVNVIDLDAYAGQNVRFAFRAIEGGTNGSADIDFSVDNFEIRLSPACVEPTNLIVNPLLHNSATITWSPASGNFEYVLDNVATNPAGSGAPTTLNSYNASPLTPLTQYYFHVRTNCGAGVYSAWSTVPFTTLATPPANNDCAGATALVPGGDFAAGEVVGTNVGATASESGNPTIPAPGCASYLGGDVWFSAVVPPSGSLTFEVNTDAGGITDGAGAVYSGACGALVLEDCDDYSSSDPQDQPLISVTGRTPGETLYFRVWEYGNNNFGTFRVSAYDASLGNDSFDLNGFKAYPNPVKDVFRLSYVKEISSVAIHNLLGQEIMNVKVNALSSEINMTGLSRGTYLVKVTVDGLVNTIKIIKE
jgi:hypothetical protein